MPAQLCHGGKHLVTMLTWIVSLGHLHHSGVSSLLSQDSGDDLIQLHIVRAKCAMQDVIWLQVLISLSLALFGHCTLFQEAMKWVRDGVSLQEGEM